MSECRRVGIVTFYWSTSNYGQMLQCFALQHFLAKSGYAAELIRCARRVPTLGNRIRRLTLQRALRKTLSFSGDLRLKRVKAAAIREDAARGFEEFKREYLMMSPEYASISELESSEFPYGALVCGSDQIWGGQPHLDWGRLAYLDFGPAGIPRVAYAPSFGSLVPKDEWPEYRRVLCSFNAIGIREDVGVDLVRDMGFPKARLVIDPTLLLDMDDYPQEMGSQEGGHVFAYMLSTQSPADVAWQEVVSYAAGNGFQLSLVLASGFLPWTDKTLGMPSELPTVPQWVWKMRSAEVVFTSSYHGTLFAILAHRPFLSFCLPNKPIANDRIVSILRRLGLLERIHNPYVPLTHQVDRPIDWAAVDQRLAELRSSSASFLLDSLRG